MVRNSLMNMPLDDEDSDRQLELLALIVMEEERVNNERHSRTSRGSVLDHTIIDRDRVQGHQRLYRDYFVDDPVYLTNVFRRRFRMNCSLFLRIQAAMEAYDRYFVQKRDACRVVGLFSLQKITAVLRMLAYGASANAVDDYVRIGETTAIETLKRFVKAVIAIFSDEYLRSPNENDIARLLEIGERRGFLEMLGSIDCMHWKWKNCLVAWQGMYSGHIHEPTIILEAVASNNHWIWHAFFGSPGSLNNLNMLERSFVFSNLTQGRTPPVNYSINGHNYTMGYYLTDGIYPRRSTFVKTIPSLKGNMNKIFVKAQKSARKDVERAFGVLQSQFAIVRGPARFCGTLNCGPTIH